MSISSAPCCRSGIPFSIPCPCRQRPAQSGTGPHGCRAGMVPWMPLFPPVGTAATVCTWGLKLAGEVLPVMDCLCFMRYESNSKDTVLARQQAQPGVSSRAIVFFLPLLSSALLLDCNPLFSSPALLPCLPFFGIFTLPSCPFPFPFPSLCCSVSQPEVTREPCSIVEYGLRCPAQGTLFRGTLLLQPSVIMQLIHFALSAGSSSSWLCFLPLP